MLNRRPKEAEEKEEIVKTKFLKGGCDVFFCPQYSPLAKASSRDVTQSVEGRSHGAGITQFWDPDAGWMRDHQTLQGVSQNRTGPSRTATTTVARVLL